MPYDTFAGVDVTNDIESVTACNSCQWMHDIEPMPQRWSGEEGG